MKCIIQTAVPVNEEQPPQEILAEGEVNIGEALEALAKMWTTTFCYPFALFFIREYQTGQSMTIAFWPDGLQRIGSLEIPRLRRPGGLECIFEASGDADFGLLVTTLMPMVLADPNCCGSQASSLGDEIEEVLVKRGIKDD